MCSASCSEPWAEAWIGELYAPFVPIDLPHHMPEVNPVTGRDYFVRVGVAVTGAPVPGEALCAFQVGGGEFWEVEVEVR